MHLEARGGDIPFLSANNEAIVQEKDVASTESVTRDVNKTQRDISRIQYTPDTMREYMIMESDNNALTHRITNDVREYGESALIAQRLATLQFIKNYGYEHTGSTTGTTTIGGSGQIETGTKKGLLGLIWEKLSGIGVSARGGITIDNKNAEKEATNLLNFTIAKIQHDALKASTINGKTDWNVFNELYHQKMHQLLGEIKDITEGRDPTQYGKDSLFGKGSLLGQAIALYNKGEAKLLEGIVDVYKKGQPWVPSSPEIFKERAEKAFNDAGIKVNP